MEKFSPSDYKLLKSLCSLRQESLRKTLVPYLKKKYDTVIVKKEYIYAPGDIPVALVAHMDTVFNYPPKNIYFDKEAGIIWSPEGLGADDRAGVFSIVKILQHGYRPTVIFTADEEIGGLGAMQLVKDFNNPTTDLNFIIELDRRGELDCVFYECDNKSFVDFIEDYGFIQNFGTYSDICEICEVWGVAGTNLSIGYQDEHSVSETLNVNVMMYTIKKVENILKDFETKEIPKFKYIPMTYESYYRGWNTKMLYGHQEPTELFCKKCNAKMDEFEAIPAYGLNGKMAYFCSNCCVNYVDWCDICNNGFEVEGNVIEHPHICPECKNRVKVANSDNGK